MIKLRTRSSGQSHFFQEDGGQACVEQSSLLIHHNECHLMVQDVAAIKMMVMCTNDDK